MLPGSIDPEARGEVRVDGAVARLHHVKRRFEVRSLHAEDRERNDGVAGTCD